MVSAVDVLLFVSGFGAPHRIRETSEMFDAEPTHPLPFRVFNHAGFIVLCFFIQDSPGKNRTAPTKAMRIEDGRSPRL